MMAEKAEGVKITDTTFRDAHQSLAATRMKTQDMLGVAEQMDQVGFYSMEVWGGATFDVCIRYLFEDPWDRMRALKKKLRKTPLQMLLRGQNLVGYRNYPDSLVFKMVEKAAEVGVGIFRVFDALNDVRNMEVAIKAVKKVGARAEGTICYTISPVHTLEKYVEVGQDLKSHGCDTICIKDMSGILSPQAGYDLVTALKREVGLPVHLHSHCVSGMAPITYFRACDAGVDIIDTAFSPLAGGTSQPAVESMVASLQGTPHDTKLDLKLLVKISEYFREIRKNYEAFLDPISERVDTNVLIHQIPGGMLSNLIFQLKQQKALDKYEDVLREVPQVREDLGWPPLVTPTSQIVGTQAVMNVLMGERYKLASREVRNYVRGLYGRHPAPIKEEVKQKIIGSQEVITCRPADLLKEEEEIPTEIEKLIEKDEDRITYCIFPHTAKAFFEHRKKEREKK